MQGISRNPHFLVCVMDDTSAALCLTKVMHFVPEQDLPHREKSPGSPDSGITEHAMWKGRRILEMRWSTCQGENLDTAARPTQLFPS